MPVDVLLVEDNPVDAEVALEALAQETPDVRVSLVKDGAEALAFLRREAPHSAAMCPNMILLDLNLPVKSGRDVLAEIKADPELRHIPVVVLTASANERDIRECYELQASSYVTKPADLDEFIDAVTAIRTYWLTFAQLPEQRQRGRS